MGIANLNDINPYRDAEYQGQDGLERTTNYIMAKSDFRSSSIFHVLHFKFERSALLSQRVERRDILIGGVGLTVLGKTKQVAEKQHPA
jgi:hypothetical protein